MLSYAPLIIFLILLWIRPEYMFLPFYFAANTVLGPALSVWRLSPEDITLRKWLKSRKSGDERRAERLVAEARAEAAKRPQ
jgi:hypothetical protein